MDNHKVADVSVPGVVQMPAHGKSVRQALWEVGWLAGGRQGREEQEAGPRPLCHGQTAGQWASVCPTGQPVGRVFLLRCRSPWGPFTCFSQATLKPVRPGLTTYILIFPA